jgi:dipeptidyl aminopeptidase/acylaminoacyl peptidase
MTRYLFTLLLTFTMFLPAVAETSSRMTEIQPGVYFYKTSYTGENGVATNLYVYLPKARKGDVPAVVVAAAGAPAFAGKSLETGDQLEHIPYAQAGFIVVGYETDGAYDESKGQLGMIAAARKFKESDSGLKNGQSAVEYATRLSGVKEDCIFTAGHSSAGTMALRVAQADPRVKACVAYAPAVEVVERLQPQMKLLNTVIPGYAAHVKSRSPAEFAQTLRKPTFFFHADDDTTVPKTEADNFVKAAMLAHRDITYWTTPTGGHYDSMISEGIPKGIEFLKKQPCCGKKP